METTPPASVARAGYVLVVDDDDALREMVVLWLTKAGLLCLQASTGDEAITQVQAMRGSIDAVVCDVMMPGRLDGFEVVRWIRRNEETVPVVLLTAHATSELDVVRGVETGAVDHLAKPFSGPVLVAKVRAMCERTRRERALRMRLRFAEENATVDPLTGLYNRRHFEQRLQAEITHARRHRRPLGVVLFDLDHFKSVNDTFGHEEGDRVLCLVADASRSVLRADDAAFRHGGEEFVLLLRACDEASGAHVARRLMDELRARPVKLGARGESRVITLSAGIAAAEPSNLFAFDELMSRADAALYRAKREGRDRVARESDAP
jgi:two-component system cell cycle response regulator